MWGEVNGVPSESGAGSPLAWPGICFKMLGFQESFEISMACSFSALLLVVSREQLYLVREWGRAWKAGTAAELQYRNTWDGTALMENCCLCFGFHPWQNLPFLSLRSKNVTQKLWFEKCGRQELMKAIYKAFKIVFRAYISELICDTLREACHF